MPPAARPTPVPSLLHLLSSHPALSGKLHAPLLKSSSLAHPVPATALLTAYAKCGRPDRASVLFDEMPTRDAVAWNALLACLVRHGRPAAAAAAFRRMVRGGFSLTDSTLCTLLKGCAVSRALRPGRQLHAQSIHRCHGDVVTGTALLDLYMSCGLVDVAMAVFVRMDCPKDVVVYSALLAGCVENRRFREAFLMLGRLPPDETMLTCALTACSATSNLVYGKQVHCSAIRHGFASETILCNALIDMYAKCGLTKAARVVFDQISGKDVVSWSSMINAYTRDGDAKDAVGLFKNMEERSPEVSPNATTFLAVISACGHAGLVDEGLVHFHLMRNKYGIEPVTEHYTCLIDLLGRAGRMEEAWDLYCSLSASPRRLNSAICVAMLNACRATMDLVRGKIVAGRLREIDPQNPGSHVVISNFHAAAKSWSLASALRSAMVQRGLRKEAGSSHVAIGVG